MATKHRYIVSPGLKPSASEIDVHETVVNEADGLLWYKDAGGNVFPVGNSAALTGRVTALETADVENVKVTGDQDIAGVKKFTDTSYMVLPQGTSAEAGVGELGAFRFNTETDEPEVKRVAGWGGFAGGGGSGGSTFYMPQGLTRAQYMFFKSNDSQGTLANFNLKSHVLPNITGNGFTRDGAIGYPVVVARGYNTQTATWHKLLELTNTSGGILTHVILPASGTTASNQGKVRITVDGVAYEHTFYTAYTFVRPWLGGVVPLFSSGDVVGNTNANRDEAQDNNWLRLLATSEVNPSSNLHCTVLTPQAALKQGIGIPFKSSLKVEYLMPNTISLEENERQAFAVVVNAMVL